MLRSYSAELNGSQLIWIDRPPEHARSMRVMVVVDEADSPTDPQPRYQLLDLSGKLQWRGDAVASQRAQRDAW